MLSSYYDAKTKEKAVSLEDVVHVKVCNSYSVGAVLTFVLKEYGKDWSNMIAVSMAQQSACRRWCARVAVMLYANRGW